ncbi:MAG: hypothetical protein ACRELY_04295 [Polyangiaceae bacterium]
MRKAKSGASAKTFAFAAFLAGFAIASCGGKIAEENSTFGSDDDASSGSDYPDVFNGFADADATTGFDAGAIVPFSDGAPPFPPVDNGPQDTTPACASRPELDCCSGENCTNSPDSAFAEIVRSCLSNGGYVCNDVYADFDSDGCAIDLRALDPNDTFVECATKQLDSQRWTCMSGGGTLMTFVDCTSR